MPVITQGIMPLLLTSDSTLQIPFRGRQGGRQWQDEPVGQPWQRLARRGRTILALGVAAVLPFTDLAPLGLPRQLAKLQCLSQPSDRLRTENTQPYSHDLLSGRNIGPVLSVSGR